MTSAPISQKPFEFDLAGIGTLLKRHKLMVPVHQREYFWTKDEVTRLFQDLAEAIDKGEDSYFLGTIVTIPQSLDSLEVIDGQQRLATTTLLLHAIAFYLEEIGEKNIAAGVITALRGPGTTRRDEPVCRISLNKLDNSLFQSIVERKSLPTDSVYLSHRKLKFAFDLAAQFVRQIVSHHDQKKHGDILSRWLDFIDYRASVMHLTVVDRSRAFRMFETLNDRGLKVGQTDLIKSYLYGECPTRLSECEAFWDTMRGALTTIEGDDEITVPFIRHSIVLMYGPVAEKEIYDRVQNVIRGETQSCVFAEALQTLSYEYAAIFNPNHDKWNTYPNAIDKTLSVLNMLDTKPLRPLILAISLRFTPHEAAKAYEALVNWGVRLVIASTPRSASVETPSFAAARKVYQGVITDTPQLRNELSSMLPSDVVFRNAFIEATSSNPNFAAYYLRELEAAHIRDRDPHYVISEDNEKVNLEHIMPLKPGPDWSVGGDIVKAYSRRFGNLCLLGKKNNSTLKSASFEEKKEVYKKTPFELTSTVADYAAWDEKTIVERQQKLADLAIKAWKI